MRILGLGIRGASSGSVPTLDLNLGLKARAQEHDSHQVEVVCSPTRRSPSSAWQCAPHCTVPASAVWAAGVRSCKSWSGSGTWTAGPCYLKPGSLASYWGRVLLLRPENSTDLCQQGIIKRKMFPWCIYTLHQILLQKKKKNSGEKSRWHFTWSELVSSHKTMTGWGSHRLTPNTSRPS